MSTTATETPTAAAGAESAAAKSTRRQRTFTLLADARGLAPDDTRIPVSFSSEAPVERYDQVTGERYLEVLDHGPKGPDLSYARDGLPFLLDHDLGRQVGIVEDVRVDEDRRLRGVLRLGNHPDAGWIAADIAAGIRSKVSIGYDPGTQYTETKSRRGEPAVRRYTRWRLYEASSVAVPADYAVGVGRHQSTATTAPAGAPRESYMSTQQQQPQTDERVMRLAELSRNNQDVPELAGRLADWIGQGTTVEQARDEVMSALRARNPAPVSGAGFAGAHHAIGTRAYAAPQDDPQVAAFMAPDSSSARATTREVAASLGFQPRFGGNFVPLNVAAMNTAPSTRAVTTTGTNTGAELVPALQMAFSDRLREDLIAPQLGVRVIPMSGGTAAFPVATADPTIVEIAENPVSGVSASDPAFATREAKPKAAVVRVAISNHIALSSTPEAASTVMRIMSRALAGHMDGRLFAGPTGGNGPIGALFTSGISVHPLGATGGAITLEALIDLEKLLIDAHGDAEDTVFITTSGVAKVLKTTLDFPTSAAGRPIWAEGRVLGRRAFAQEWMPSDLTKSTGEDLHAALMYSPRRAGHMACLWQGAEVVVDRLTGADKQLTYLTGAIYYDAVVLHPGAVAAIRDIDVS